jgi:hypothetical protein
MDVEHLRRILARLPGDMPVVLEDSQSGWMQNARLYIAPAHIDRRPSGNYLHADDRNGRDNCHALLLSGFHQPDKIIADITPDSESSRILNDDSRTRPARRRHAHPRDRH